MLPTDKDDYITSPKFRSRLLPRVCKRPAIIFYPRLYTIIRHNGRQALKGLYDDHRWAESSYDVFHLLEKVGVSFEITGLNNMRFLESPVVFVANHMSTMETLILPCIIQPLQPVVFVVKKSLLTMPVFGPVMRARNPIVVNRTNPREDLKTVLDEGTRILAGGKSVIIFPQSTRAVTFNPEEFNSLGVKLALRAGVPVMPVALKTDAWGIGRIVKEFGPIDISKTVHIAFGALLHPAGRGISEHQAVIRFISEHLDTWERRS